MVKEYATFKEAKEEWIKRWKDKTGNLWENRLKFEKKPGKFYVNEKEYNDDTELGLKDLKKNSTVACTLG